MHIFTIMALWRPDQSYLNATRHANVGVKLPNPLYNKTNNKLPHAVANAADSICDCTIPALKEYPLLVEEEPVEFDVLLSVLAPESTALNWLMTKDVASSR